MPQPVAYTRNYDFTNFQENFPSQPLPAAPIDANLDAIGTSTGQIVGRLAQIQRDDGALQNQTVTVDSLTNDVRALLGSPLNPRGAWVTATAYAKLDMVSVNGITYVAVSDHTSGVFATDLAANKWLLFSNPAADQGSPFFQKFSGNGVTTSFTLSSALGTDEKALLVFYNDGTAAKFQPLQPTAFTVNGTALTISPAPVLGTDNIYVFSPSTLLGAIAASQAAAEAAALAAGTSATNAANSASSASTSASNASTSATNASNSASSASTSASTATTQASNASTSASNASTSATNASNSAAASAASSQLTLNAQSGTTYTLVLSDANKLIECTNAAAITLTIPTNASVAFPLGTQIAIAQGGAGQITISPAGGVTLLSKFSRLKCEAQDGMIFLLKQATNTWRVTGDLVP